MCVNKCFLRVHRGKELNQHNQIKRASVVKMKEMEQWLSVRESCLASSLQYYPRVNSKIPIRYQC